MSETLSPEQVEIVKAMAGKFSKTKIARAIKVGCKKLRDWEKQNNFSLLNKWYYTKEQVQAVCEMYNEHGFNVTQEAFPQLKVRSIVSKAKSKNVHNELLKPRQRRWTDAELVEIAKMGGLLSFSQQAEFFNRPRAGAGSIDAAWRKRFNCGSRSFNGLTNQEARFLKTKQAKPLKVPFLNKKTDTYDLRTIYLWVDLEHNLRDDCPIFIKEAIKTMAQFQRWLFKSDNVRDEIKKLMSERNK